SRSWTRCKPRATCCRNHTSNSRVVVQAGSCQGTCRRNQPTQCSGSPVALPAPTRLSRCSHYSASPPAWRSELDYRPSTFRSASSECARPGTTARSCRRFQDCPDSFSPACKGLRSYRSHGQSPGNETGSSEEWRQQFSDPQIPGCQILTTYPSE